MQENEENPHLKQPICSNQRVLLAVTLFTQNPEGKQKFKPQKDLFQFISLIFSLQFLSNQTN